MQGRPSTLDLLQDVGGLGCPDEGFWVFVVMVDVIKDRRNQLLDAAEDSAAQAVFRQVAEESFDHIQPRATGGREVHVEARVAAEPALDLLVLVGRVVIHDHMDLLVLRNHVIDGAQKLQPFLMAVPVIAHGDHFAFQGIERSEQSCRSVALVIVGHGAATAFLDRQAGLGAVQRLNLALLVGAQHEGVLGRIQVQADDVFQLLRELGIAAELEGAYQMRLQSMGVPDAAHAASLIPAADAMVRVDQWVALAGF